MRLRTRHAIPSTLLETGRLTRSLPLELAGPAEALNGPARWREVYVRLRRQHSRRASLWLLFGVWRFGVVLHGESVGRTA